MNKRYAFPALLLLLCTALSLPGQELISFQLKGSLPASALREKYGDFIRFGVRHYKITYTTFDLEGRVDTASGLISYPNLPGNAVLPMLAYLRGTIGSRDAVPSNLDGGYEIAEAFAGMGYYAVSPDLLGSGDSRGFHPYVHADSEAWASLDMLEAAHTFAADREVLLNTQLFITGYSQGGHAAAALHREIEARHADRWTVTASAPMSGPYSISGVMRELMLGDTEYFYPAFLINTILSYNLVYGLYDSPAAVLQPFYADLAERFLAEELTLGEVNQACIDQLTADHGASLSRFMLQDSVLENFTNNPDHPISAALRDNDLYDWAPQAPTRLFYCRADDQVPFRNSIVADSVMTLNGAPNVAAVEVSDTADHVECAFPAVFSGILFFSFFQDLDVGTSGVGQIAGAPVAAYPNPATTDLTVEGPADARFELYDLEGRALLQGRLRASPEAIPIGHLPAGLYVLRLTTERGSWTDRVVVGGR